MSDSRVNALGELVEHRCVAGSKTRDDACTRHPRHSRCQWCKGFYGVPHDDGEGCHSRYGDDGYGKVRCGPPSPDCACRFCVTKFRPAAPSLREER